MTFLRDDYIIGKGLRPVTDYDRVSGYKDPILEDRKNALEAGQSELIGPMGPIAPRFWELLIQPGWEITFRFRGMLEYMNKSIPPVSSPIEPRDKAFTKFSFFRRG